jgi:hypothetical protein
MAGFSGWPSVFWLHMSKGARDAHSRPQAKAGMSLKGKCRRAAKISNQ